MDQVVRPDISGSDNNGPDTDRPHKAGGDLTDFSYDRRV